MKNKNCTTLALALLALAASQTRAQNLVTNGSFELPAYPGNGDAYQTDPGFTIPGWNLVGSSNLFVDYGVHLIDQLPPRLQIRYADGRQALCLNDYGLGGAQISQLFNTVPGQNYVLSFAQADASLDAATVSEVTVRISALAQIQRTFSRTNDPSGYTVKSWHFTASNFRPKLHFLNTTTNGLPGISPFLDAVSILPGSLVAVSSNTVVPGGGSNHFGQLPAGLGVSGSNRVFFGASADGQQGIYGMYPSDPVIPSDPMKIADTNTPIPGGSGNFTSFTGSGGTPPDPCISGNNVVFGGLGANNQQGIYAFPVDPALPIDPIRIADRNTAVPPGNLGNFVGFTPDSDFPGDPMISGNRIAFYAFSAAGHGIYSATLDGAITTIADRTMHTPGTVNDHFIYFGSTPPDPCISGKDVVFAAYSGNGGDINTDGVYLSTDGVLSRVADTTTAMPGGGGNSYGFHTFDTYPGGPQVSSGNVLFWAASSVSQQGLFVKTPVDPIKVVANALTSIPGGHGTFTGFSAMSLSWSAVAFVGLGANGQMGIYVAYPHDPIYPADPMKVLDLNDTLDGKTITGLQLSRTGLDRDHNLLAFGATFSDGTQSLYTLNVFTGLRITSTVRTGANLQLSFTSQVGYKYNVQSFTYLVNGVVRDVATGIPGNGSIVHTTVSNAFVYPQQFYRIEQAQ